MGFLRPDLPKIDLVRSREITHSERIRPMARHLAERGFGTPGAVHYLQVVRIGLFILGGIGFAMATRGIRLGNIGLWWREPIVFEKLVLWSLLFGVLGVGCSFGPLHRRFFPPICCPRYWLRPGTIRLAPWPNRVPLTGGDTRAAIDTVLYGLLVAATVFALLSNGTGPDTTLRTTVGVIPVWKIAAIVGLLALVGLRDKVVILAAGGEVYGPLTVAFLFPGVDMIVAAKLVMVVMWMGAATSKLNKHFPFVLSIMMSNSPVIPRSVKRTFFGHFPDDLRPGRRFRVLAHAATFVECVAPLVLLFSPGVIPSFVVLPIVAAAVLVLFHLGVLSAMPAGVPLEWNVLMIFGIFTLFIDKAGLKLGDLKHPIPVASLIVVVIGAAVLGNLFPQKIWFLPPATRYYAGNGDSALWCLTKSAQETIEKNVITMVSMPHVHFEKHYDKQQAEVLTYLGYAFRAMNTHGRALFTLANRAIPPGRDAAYTIVDGERICTTVVGWNFGDGHLPTAQLIAALQRRCQFEPGQTRIVILDAQPIHRKTQQYRLVDAATGEFERGVIQVADLVSRQPWADDVPVRVCSATTTNF
jgi:hypothetical protein